MNATTTTAKLDFNGYPTADSIIGLAPLMTLACNGADLTQLGQTLLDEGSQNSALGPSALLDVSVIMQLSGNADLGLKMQQQALADRQLYRIPAKRQPVTRLLILKAPGPLAANTPLEFLVEDSNIELTMLYVSQNSSQKRWYVAFPETLPEHDVMFVGIAHSEQNLPILQLIDQYVQCWPRPVLNLPNRIAPLSRDIISVLLQHMPGTVMPETIRVQRPILERVASAEANKRPVRIDMEFPILLGTVASNAGKRLTRADNVADISDYLAKTPDAEFYVTPFVDYRSADGQFRKYRIAFIDGRPYAAHMAISTDSTPRYLGTLTGATAEQRQEEERFIANFDDDFARRHAAAFDSIARRVGLDYLVLDCAETREGKLLILELDSSAVIHAMDSAKTFPYKKPQLRKIAGAFSDMLVKTVARRS